MKNKLKPLLLLAWMSLIFYMSSCNGESSGNMSSSLLLFIARILNIEDTENFILNYAFIIRKLAHFTEYFVLGILMYINLHTKTKKALMLSVLLSFLYAISD